jgi:hypothetical protein
MVHDCGSKAPHVRIQDAFSPFMNLFFFSGKIRYRLTHFATSVLIQWQNGVSYDSHCQWCSSSDSIGIPYLLTHFAIDAPIQWQNWVSSESFCHWCSYSVAK